MKRWGEYIATLIRDPCYCEHTSNALVFNQSPGLLCHDPSIPKKTQVDGDELSVLEMDAVLWCVSLIASLSLWSLDGSSLKCDHLRTGWKNMGCSEMSRDETAEHSYAHQQELHGGRE